MDIEQQNKFDVFDQKNEQEMPGRLKGGMNLAVPKVRKKKNGHQTKTCP